MVATLSFCGTLSHAAPAEIPSHAADTHALSVKRQVVDCMNKRMAANRTLSYNDASRECRAQVTQLVAQQSSFAGSVGAGSTGAGQAVASSAAPLKAVSAP
jgi:hypothetical protein